MPQPVPQEPANALAEPEEGLWLFGYGSLIWKPPPHFDRRIPGYIEGYVRRFWQASEDHRGTPSSPGRVVTLLNRSFWETLGEEPSEPPTPVYGAAYHIPHPHIKTVKTYLDIREINGYSIHYTPFNPIPTAPSPTHTPTPTTTPTTTPTATPPTTTPPIQNCMLYIGLPNNPQFLGRQHPQAVAEVIARSTGPSGRNSEYLFMLEEALDGLAPEGGDGHVRDLARRVRVLMREGKQGVGALGGDVLTGDAVENEVERVNGEETEKFT